MRTKGTITIYHQDGLDLITHLEKWTRYNYNAWFFGGKGASIQKGYDNANDMEVRIPYKKNGSLDITHFSVGDIIVCEDLNLNIETQEDLKNYDIYNVTSINNNNFGSEPHIGGK